MSRGRPTRCRASGGRSPAGRWLRPDRCFQCGTPCGRCGSDDPGRPGSGSRGPAGCAAGERCCLWQCPAAATAGSGCNRCRSGCTAPEYPARVLGNGGHLRKAWVSLPFLIYRVSGYIGCPGCLTGQAAHRRKEFRCVPQGNTGKSKCVRISGCTTRYVLISEQNWRGFGCGQRRITAARRFFCGGSGADGRVLHVLQRFLKCLTVLSDNSIMPKQVKNNKPTLFLKKPRDFSHESLLQFQYTTPENRLQGAVCFSWK